MIFLLLLAIWRFIVVRHVAQSVDLTLRVYSLKSKVPLMATKGHFLMITRQISAIVMSIVRKLLLVKSDRNRRCEVFNIS